MDAEVRLSTLLLGVLLSIATVTQGVQQTTNPRIIEHPEDQFVAKNEPATLNCKAEGEPLPTITWYRDGRQVTTANENPKSHRMLLPSGQLFFLRIIHNKHNKPDVGVYYCNATNPETKVSVVSRNATLEIAAIRDDFREIPTNTDVAVGDTAILDCHPPKGSPNPRVKWKRDGETIALNSRVAVQDEGSLMIQDANKGDSGMYTCVATNIAGSKETPAARLSVLEKPTFVKLPDDVQEDSGADIVFSCEASGDPSPTIIWKREEGQIPSGRSHIGNDRSLNIDNISVQDEGNYICRAENAVGFVEATARLSVHSQPSFIVTPKDKTVGVGRRVSLQCEVTGNPPPAVFWNRDADNNLMFPRQDNGRFTVQDDGTLVIEPVRKADAGEYVCQAYSIAGSALAKARLDVKDVDPRPPPIIHQGPQNQTLPVNSVAMLQCASSGDPRPAISWLKHGRPLPAHDARITQLDSGTLQISDLRISDTAMYTCRALSETGETTWSAALVVEAPTNPQVIFHRTPEPSTFPGPPSMPQVNDIDSNSMRLSWKANPNHGASPVFAYTVEYFSHETGEGWIVAADSISEQNYVVKNLRTDTAYQFLVRAQNSHGLSLPSAVTAPIRSQGGGGSGKGGGSRPNLPKYDIGLVQDKLTGTVVVMKKPEVVSSTAIKINWEVKKSHRYIEGYHIKYRVMPDMEGHVGHEQHHHHHIEFTIITVSTPASSMYVLRNLQKYQWYEVRIQPFYFTVEGQESNTVRSRTFEDVPSSAPQRIHSKLMENNTMLLTWSPPPREHHNGPLRGYKVLIKGNETKWDREITTNATTDSLLIRHLVAGMPYRVQIAAFNKMGDGIKSDPHIVGGDNSHGLMHGIARQPWFIATLIGTVGGTLWFALCVFSVWLYRKRKARKKMNKNGVMNVPVHKSEDPSRLGNYFGTLNAPNYLQKDIQNHVTSNQQQPDVTHGVDVKDEKEPLYNSPITTGGMMTFGGNKLPAPPGPVSPYATTTLLQTNADSAFRPIQPGNGYCHENSGDPAGNYSGSIGTSSAATPRVTPRLGHRTPRQHTPMMPRKPELPMDTCEQCGDHLHSPISECESMMDDPRYPLMGGEPAPVLYLPPPPDNPPPSDIGTPPDSPTPRPRHRPRPNGNQGGGVYSDGGGRCAHRTQAPQHPDHHQFRTMSPRMHAGRAYSPRAMSEPERGPTPPVRAYKLVPITEPRHYSDTEGPPIPPQRHSPPSPAPEDPMMERGIQSSLPSIAGGNQHHHDHHDEMEEEEEEEEEYVGESDMEPQLAQDCDVDSNVAASWASDVASEGEGENSSMSSSDGSFLAEADFASAVAKAAELSGLTVVGSTVSDPNAGQKEKKYRKHRERSKQRERPSSPYSTDSNYSSVPAVRNPYPKSERKRQLQEHQQRSNSNSGKRNPPPLKAKPSTDLPSYNKPTYPSSYRPPPHASGELRQNPLAAFDTSDTPIV